MSEKGDVFMGVKINFNEIEKNKNDYIVKLQTLDDELKKKAEGL